jgi:hypothetical protein
MHILMVPRSNSLSLVFKRLAMNKEPCETERQ